MQAGDFADRQYAGPQAARERDLERRLRRRYNLDLDVRCRPLHTSLMVSGRIRDMSSKALCFLADEMFARGTMVELCIEWPAVLFDGSALQLKVRGPVIRSEGQQTAVLVSCYEFHTRRATTLPQPSLAGLVAGACIRPAL